MSKTLYAQRDAEGLGEHYLRHIQAMTAEGLHDKSDIAAELAFRDWQLEHSQPRISTPCPTCCRATLFVSDSGWLTCSAIECAQPVVHTRIRELLAIENEHELARKERDDA